MGGKEKCHPANRKMALGIKGYINLSLLGAVFLNPVS